MQGLNALYKVVLRWKWYWEGVMGANHMTGRGQVGR